MSAATNRDEKLEALFEYVDVLGGALLAIHSVDDRGVCTCSLKEKCLAAGKHPNAKCCPNGLNSATTDRTLIRQWHRSFPNGNWAIRTGGPLPGRPGEFLGVPDIDLRNGGLESVAELAGIGRALVSPFKVNTGGGGYHLYLAFSKPPGSRTIAPGIDFQGVGKYVLIAGSRHKSGKSYALDTGVNLRTTEVPRADGWLDGDTEIGLPRPGRDGNESARNTVLGEAFALAGRAGVVMPDGTMYVNCVNSDQHSDARGRGEDSSTVILPPAGGSRFGGYACRHGNCVNLKWSEVLKALPSEAVGAAQRKYPMLRPVPQEGPPVAPSVHQQRRDELKDVRQRVQMVPSGKTGSKVKSDIVNLITILTYDPRWENILTWDDFSQVLRMTKPPPWHDDDKPKVQGTTWTDEDTTRLDSWLRRNWGFEAKSTILREGVYVVGRRDAVNPLQDWLSSLRWDGVPRMATWLSRYLGAADTPYTRAIGSKWMISAVARGFRPGCKADHVLILEGPQGRGKSTSLKTLCGAEWFSDTPLDIGNKDAYMALRGRWCVELAELASLSKTDADRVKAFFSSPSDYYRPPYGKEMVDVPRQCVFAGSVNLGQYLRDETGNRRFWPILCGVIDLEGLAADREQLWAEAVVAYKSGTPWWPSYEERELFEAEQDAREEVDGWTPTVAAWAQSEQAKHMLKKGYLTSSDVLSGALQVDVGKHDRAAAARIGIIMARGLRWNKVRVSHEGTRIYAFAPK